MPRPTTRVMLLAMALVTVAFAVRSVQAAPPEPVAVEVGVAPLPGPAVTPSGAAMLGRLHVVFVHLPIGLLAAVLLLDVLAFGLRQVTCERCGLWLLGATAASCLPALLTGFLVEASFPETGPLHDLVERHETLMLVVTALIAGAFGLRLWKRDLLVGAWRGSYLTLIVLAVLTIALAAHQGGKLAHGPDFLPF